jgi:hypothetical protein
LERNRRIKVVAVALITVLASVAIGGFAYASSNNAAGTGTAQAYVWSKTESNFQTVTVRFSSFASILSVATFNVPISAYYHVVCDGYTFITGNVLGIAIGTDSLTPDLSTYRFYGINGNSNQTYGGIHTEKVYYLPKGVHTFYFLATKFSGTGPDCGVAYLSMTVTLFTDGSILTAAEDQVGGNPATR